MDLGPSQQTAAAGKAKSVMAREVARQSVPKSASPADAAPKISGYGLPCANCHLYYPADLDSCPTCHCKERVAPDAPGVTATVSQAAVEGVPDTEKVEQEREEFLRQFKSQLYTAHAEVANRNLNICTLSESHPGEPEKAEVCRHCYERLQERLDVCEASLHIDLKEAAQIVYDAVWADASDPSKTYQNAASALLNELRKRAGLSTVLGPFQPLAH